MEWKKILNLRHLVRCFEYTFLLPENVEASFYRLPVPWFGHNLPPVVTIPLNDPIYSQLWSENFHIATYRALILGAVLSNLYQEPFFSPQKPEQFLEPFARGIQEGYELDYLPPEDVEHSCKFPVYDMEAYGNMGSAFDTFTDWLLEDCKFQITARDNVDLEESNHSEGPLFREVARVMVIWSHFCNGGNGTYFQYPDFAQFDPDFKYVDLSGPTRTVHMVSIGDFQIHEAEMCASVQAVKNMLPMIRQLPTTLGPKIPPLSSVLHSLYTRSGRPNQREQGQFGGPSPEPPLQIFEYIFRKQFNLVFKSDAFHYVHVDQPWERFCQAGDIFGNASRTNCPVESAYPPPILSYCRI